MNSTNNGFKEGLKSYLTVAKEAKSEFIERKSRFIGHISPADNEEDAKAFIELVREEHAQASHNVWCYIFNDKNIVRASDDGEPSGTAGRPAIEVLTKENITNVVCVVTRYFGGILLGAGGLIRAYASGAKAALDAAGLIRMQPCSVYDALVPYHYYGRVEAWLLDSGLTVQKTDFADNVTVRVSMSEDETRRFRDTMNDLTAGRISLEYLGQIYAGTPIA